MSLQWGEIYSNIIAGVVILVIGGIGGAIGGYLKGKKVSQDGIYVKENELLPLINELNPYSNYEFNALRKIEIKIVDRITLDSFNSIIGDDLISECKQLYTLVNEYNNIKLTDVAHSVIVEKFKEGFITLYGSIIDGIINHLDRNGNEYEEEHVVEEMQIIEHYSSEKTILELLNSEGMATHSILIDKENDICDYLYKEIVDIYSSALKRQKNNPPKRDVLINIGELTPAEYIADYDFFEIYNNNEKVVLKYKIREEIILKSQAIIQTAKEMVEKINKQFIAPKI